jgi:hypothetical protein
MSALLNSTQSMIHDVYNYYLWTLSLAGTVQTASLSLSVLSKICVITRHSLKRTEALGQDRLAPKSSIKQPAKFSVS